VSPELYPRAEKRRIQSVCCVHIQAFLFSSRFFILFFFLGLRRLELECHRIWRALRTEDNTKFDQFKLGPSHLPSSSSVTPRGTAALSDLASPSPKTSMLVAFPAPVLSVTADAVRELEGSEALSGLWTRESLFTFDLLFLFPSLSPFSLPLFFSFPLLLLPEISTSNL